MVISNFSRILEVVGVISLKESNGFSRLKPTLLCLLAMGGSLFLMSLSMLSIPMGTTYAVWTGIGSAGSVVVGMLLFGESRDSKKILFISCILVGVIGLKLTSGH